MRKFIGKGKTLRNPATILLTKTLYFGGGVFPAGCEIKAFEAQNGGYVIRQGEVPRGETKIARE